MSEGSIYSFNRFNVRVDAVILMSVFCGSSSGWFVIKRF